MRHVGLLALCVSALVWTPMSDETITSRWRPNPFPRCIAIGLVQQSDAFLCAEVTHDDGSVKGCRPLGGGIEMGETAADALSREFVEEVHAVVEVGARRVVLENIFRHEGALGHEIVFAFDVVIKSPGLIQPKRFLRTETGRVTALDWIDLDRFRSGTAKLFPEGLLPHLA